MSSTGLYEDLGLYLAAGDSRLTVGKTLFGYQLPESTSSPDVSSTGPVVAIIPDAGLGPVDRYRPSNGGQPAMERPGFTIVVRSTDGAGGVPSAQPAMAVASAVHRLLEGFPPNSTVAGGTHGRTKATGQGVVHCISQWAAERDFALEGGVVGRDPAAGVPGVGEVFGAAERE